MSIVEERGAKMPNNNYRFAFLLSVQSVFASHIFSLLLFGAYAFRVVTYS